MLDWRSNDLKDVLKIWGCLKDIPQYYPFWKWYQTQTFVVLTGKVFELLRISKSAIFSWPFPGAGNDLGIASTSKWARTALWWRIFSTPRWLTGIAPLWKIWRPVRRAMAMEIINTKPGYKINCTGPSTLGATLNLGVSSNYDWNYFAICKNTFQRLGQILFAIWTNTFCNYNCTPAEYSVCSSSRVSAGWS